MKHLSEYRDAAASRELCDRIHRATTRPWSILEVCGGQTHSIVRHGLEQLLPSHVRLLHGPGCPVCVTPVAHIDAAIELSRTPGVTVCSFGDLMRVPGSSQSLLSARALGASVRLVYGPLDALELARREPRQQFVFLAVGFETTAPATAMSVRLAREVPNYSLLCAHVRVPPALERLLGDEQAGVSGLLAAGHVCSVMGLEEYVPLAARHRTPIVATGFEPVDLLRGVLACVEQLEAGRAEVENQYERVVAAAGNSAARALLSAVFEPCDLNWRGLGPIPRGGLQLRPGLERWDAARRFGLKLAEPPEPSEPSEPPERQAELEAAAKAQEPSPCIAGLVLLGRRRPRECPAFGRTCTPERPLGAPMVSSEGACAAYYRYGPVGVGAHSGAEAVASESPPAGSEAARPRP